MPNNPLTEPKSNVPGAPGNGQCVRCGKVLVWWKPTPGTQPNWAHARKPRDGHFPVPD